VINQNPTQVQELTPTSSRISKILRVLKNPPVQTTIRASIVGAIGRVRPFFGCLNKSDAERDDCLKSQWHLAIGFGAVGAVFSAVIFKCIREFNQHYQRDPSSSVEASEYTHPVCVIE
jgi:hypothetical protein